MIKGLFIKGYSQKRLKEQIREHRKRVRKETLREVLDKINTRMDKGEGSKFDDGYEAALKEVFIEVAMMIGSTGK